MMTFFKFIKKYCVRFPKKITSKTLGYNHITIFWIDPYGSKLDTLELLLKLKIL